ncbi:MAG: FtsW/RodA/SpoVE family cell cycle protein [Oscillospiraceae bacterium]|jgi:rod shape determining protein RodA|nr:FtsW/RodA/SpoVE family cell cycle protein [Oscillospiraceae bacterium]
MKRIFKPIADYFLATDIVLWVLTVAASAYGLILIHSLQRAGNYNYFRTQLLAIAIGYIGAIIISVIDYEYILKYWWIGAFVGAVLCILVLFFGITVQGTAANTAWLNLPFGLSFQPSELLKIIFIITFAKHLSHLENNNTLKTLKGFCFLTLHALVPMLLIRLQGDDGTLLIFAIMYLIMMFAAGVQLRYFAIMGGAILAAAPFLWYFVMNEDQKNRIMVLFDLDGGALQNFGWQQYQGKVSVASGMMQGYGLGQGPRVEYEIVPEQANDFIFTVAGEELGFIGCIVILLLLGLIAARIMQNGSRARDGAGAYICSGMFAIIATQSIINLGMVLGFLPVIGITLPFFSSGGTSVMCLYLGLGLLQSVSLHRDDINSIKPNDMLLRKKHMQRGRY